MVKKPKVYKMRNAPYHHSLTLSGCKERRARLHSRGTNHSQPACHRTSPTTHDGPGNTSDLTPIQTLDLIQFPGAEGKDWAQRCTRHGVHTETRTRGLVSLYQGHEDQGIRCNTTKGTGQPAAPGAGVVSV